MTGKKWVGIAILAVVATLDLVPTLRAHHAPGAVTSVSQILGWAAFVVVLSICAVTLLRELRTALHARRVNRTYTRLARRDAEHR